MAYHSPAYCGALLQRLKQLYDKGQLCDFSLFVDGVEVKLHSVVLFSASAYFKMLMDKGLLTEQRFCLQNGSLESLQILINFMYTGCLVMSENNILITLGLATQLDVPEAIELCQQFIQDIANKNHDRTLDSISSKIKSEPGLSVNDVEIKKELDESEDWDRKYSLSSKLNASASEDQKQITSISEQQVNDVLCYKEKTNKCTAETLVKQEISKLTVINKNHHGKRKQQLPPSAETEEQKLCHVCVVCNKNFKWHSLKALHQRSHWSVLYANLEANHVISQSKQIVVSTAAGQQTCLPCQQTFPFVSEYRAHLLTLHRNHMFKYLCRRCPYKRFQYSKHLFIHNVIQHRTSCCSKLVKCPLCPRHFLYKRSLLLHKYSVHTRLSRLRSPFSQKKRRHQTPSVNSVMNARWKCEEKNCQCAFSSKNKLIEHMTMVHPQVNYTCPMNRCKFSTVIKLMLERHRKKYHDTSNTNICDVCGKIFQRGFRLKIHMFSRHRIKDPELTVYHCPVEGCHYSTVLKDGVKKHMMRHQPEKPFTCEICGKCFKTEKSVGKHMGKVHLGIRNYICDICGMSYGEESELKIHMVRHSEKKTYSCEHCHYATFDKGNYKTHLYGKHGIKLEEHMKIFECNLCQFTTSIKYQYSDHMRVHYQMRDIPCPHCNKMFITRKSMRSHIVKCHKPKDYHCSVCTYSSAVKSKVHEHMRVIHTHRHYKPYKCPYCSFRCATGGNCRKHVKQRHKGQEVKYIKLDVAEPLASVTTPECQDITPFVEMPPVKNTNYVQNSSSENGYEMPKLIAIQPHTTMVEFGAAFQQEVAASHEPSDVLPLSMRKALGSDTLDQAGYGFDS